MKFIVDAQLPERLSQLLNYRGHDSLHTCELPLNNATSDNAIIELSTAENRVVITKDSDFLENFLINALPEKLIIVKIGNAPNAVLPEIFNRHLPLIVSMISRSNLVEINKSEIAEHK